jgi:hypothetical protein
MPFGDHAFGNARGAGEHANALAALSPNAERVQLEEEEVGGVEDAFSQMAPDVPRRG